MCAGITFDSSLSINSMRAPISSFSEAHANLYQSFVKASVSDLDESVSELERSPAWAEPVSYTSMFSGKF